MNKYQLICIPLLLWAMLSICLGQTHLRNLGASIQIGEATQMRVSGDVMNLSTGGIDGTWRLVGDLHLRGNWENHASTPDVFPQLSTIGSLRLTGQDQAQLMGGTEATEVGWLVLDNPNGLILSQELTITDRLSLHQGTIDARSFLLTVSNPLPDAIDSASQDRYIIGKLRRFLEEESYLLPIGTETYLEPAQLTIHNSHGLPYVDIEFIEARLSPPPTLTHGGTPVREFLDYGYWSIQAPSAANANFDLTLSSTGHQNGGSDPRQHAIYSRNHQGWQHLGVHDNATQTGSGIQTITATRTYLEEFGDFLIGKSEYVLHLDPGSLAELDGFSIGGNGANSRMRTVRFSASSPGAYTFSLFDYQGKLLFHQQGIAQSGPNEFALDLQVYARGVYLLQVERKGEMHQMKVW